jgi:hypothetical protein
MRRLAVFAMLLVLVATPVLAGSSFRSSFASSITEYGWGIPISFGVDKKDNCGMIVAVDCRGKVIVPSDGVWPVPEDAGVVSFYIIPDDVTRVNQYEIRWGFGPVVQEKDLEPTTFDGDIGWRFSIGPDEYGPVGDLRTLTIWVKQFDAKHWFVRAIFKVTLFKGSIKTTDRILLSVVPAAMTSASNGPSPEMTAFTAELDARFQKVGEYTTKLDERLTKLEQWAEQVAQTTPATMTQNHVTGKVEFTLNAVFAAPGTTSIEIAGRVYHGRSVALCLDPGVYQAKIRVGNRSTDWVSFQVKPGMGSVNIGEVGGNQ